METTSIDCSYNKRQHTRASRLDYTNASSGDDSAYCILSEQVASRLAAHCWYILLVIPYPFFSQKRCLVVIVVQFVFLPLSLTTLTSSKRREVVRCRERLAIGKML